MGIQQISLKPLNLIVCGVNKINLLRFTSKSLMHSHRNVVQQGGSLPGNHRIKISLRTELEGPTMAMVCQICDRLAILRQFYVHALRFHESGGL